MRSFLILLFLSIGINIEGQTVSYTYRPLAAEGCQMKYSVIKQDTTYYIVATVSSDRLMFIKEPVMLIKNYDGKVVKLEGDIISNGSDSAGILVSNVMIPVTEINSTAQFKITPEQFEIIKNGIAKVRLSTIPVQHERTFKKDKIGKKLYKFYQKAQMKSNDF